MDLSEIKQIVLYGFVLYWTVLHHLVLYYILLYSSERICGVKSKDIS